jgi:hypothetical protein
LVIAGYGDAMKLSHIPPRIATGAYILNSGLSKLNADDDTAKGLHGMAAGAYPMLEDVEPRSFVKALGMGEVAVGGGLLAPFVPSWLAGFALTGFSSALIGLYLKTPGMTQEGSVRPTSHGTPFAKDIWMVGTGLGLLIDGLTPSRGRRRAVRKAARTPARKAALARATAKGYLSGARGATKTASKGYAQAGRGAARGARGVAKGARGAAKGTRKMLQFKAA